MKSFRAAHAWLRGYSDARAGKTALEPNEIPFGPDFNGDYVRGYLAGS